MLYCKRCIQGGVGGGRGQERSDCRDEGYMCRKVMAAQPHTATNLVAYVQNCHFGQLAKLLPEKR